MPILTPDERIGTLLAGRYRLCAILGTGGMGVLFRAVDEVTKAPVAVKMLKPEHSMNPDRMARFLRETRITAALRHPNVAAVFDSGSDETGAPYLVMELLEGRSLEEELAARHSIPFDEALAIVLPIGEALSAAHASGVVHRDLKPSNIYLSRRGDGPAVPKLLDFGIAKSDTNDFETQTGVLIGSPSYMAPEQARDGECGTYTDVWGLAAVVYRASMGEAPHAAESVHEMLAKRMSEPARPFDAPGVKKSTCSVIDRALEREPERRYRTMRAFIDALENAHANRNEPSDETQELFAGSLPTGTREPVPAVQPGSSASSRKARSARAVSIGFGLALLALFALAQRSRHADALAGERRGFTTEASNAIGPSAAKLPAALSEPSTAVSAREAGGERATPPIAATPRARQASVPSARARLPSENPVRAPLRAAPEYERRTGLPLATEW